MSSSESLLQRMNVAVQNAHKAISLLKAENDKLHEENNALKVEIAALKAKLTTPVEAASRLEAALNILDSEDEVEQFATPTSVPPKQIDRSYNTNQKQQSTIAPGSGWGLEGDSKVQFARTAATIAPEEPRPIDIAIKTVKKSVSSINKSVRLDLSVPQSIPQQLPAPSSSSITQSSSVRFETSRTKLGKRLGGKSVTHYNLQLKKISESNSRLKLLFSQLSSDNFRKLVQELLEFTQDSVARVFLLVMERFARLQLPHNWCFDIFEREFAQQRYYIVLMESVLKELYALGGKYRSYYTAIMDALKGATFARLMQQDSHNAAHFIFFEKPSKGDVAGVRRCLTQWVEDFQKVLSIKNHPANDGQPKHKRRRTSRTTDEERNVSSSDDEEEEENGDKYYDLSEESDDDEMDSCGEGIPSTTVTADSQQQFLSPTASRSVSESFVTEEFQDFDDDEDNMQQNSLLSSNAPEELPQFPENASEKHSKLKNILDMAMDDDSDDDDLGTNIVPPGDLESAAMNVESVDGKAKTGISEGMDGIDDLRRPTIEELYGSKVAADFIKTYLLLSVSVAVGDRCLVEEVTSAFHVVASPLFVADLYALQLMYTRLKETPIVSSSFQCLFKDILISLRSSSLDIQTTLKAMEIDTSSQTANVSSLQSLLRLAQCLDGQLNSLWRKSPPELHVKHDAEMQPKRRQGLWRSLASFFTGCPTLIVQSKSLSSAPNVGSQWQRLLFNASDSLEFACLQWELLAQRSGLLDVSEVHEEREGMEANQPDRLVDSLLAALSSEELDTHAVFSLPLSLTEQFSLRDSLPSPSSSALLMHESSIQGKMNSLVSLWEDKLLPEINKSPDLAAPLHRLSDQLASFTKHILFPIRSMMYDENTHSWRASIKGRGMPLATLYSQMVSNLVLAVNSFGKLVSVIPFKTACEMFFQERKQELGGGWQDSANQLFPALLLLENSAKGNLALEYCVRFVFNPLQVDAESLDPPALSLYQKIQVLFLQVVETVQTCCIVRLMEGWSIGFNALILFMRQNFSGIVGHQQEDPMTSAALLIDIAVQVGELLCVHLPHPYGIQTQAASRCDVVEVLQLSARYVSASFSASSADRLHRIHSLLQQLSAHSLVPVFAVLPPTVEANMTHFRALELRALQNKLLIHSVGIQEQAVISLFNEVSTGSHTADSNPLLRGIPSTWNTTLHAKFTNSYGVPAKPLTTAQLVETVAHVQIWRQIERLVQERERRETILWSALRSDGTTGSTGSSVASSTTSSARKVPSEDNQNADVWNVTKFCYNYSATMSMSSVFNRNAASSSSATKSTSTGFKQLDRDDFYIILGSGSTLKTTVADLYEQVRKVIHRLPNDWDILYLGGYLPRNKQLFRELSRQTDAYNHINYILDGYAYVLREKAAVKLVRELMPLTAPVHQYLASLVYYEELQVNASFSSWCVMH